MRHLMYALLFGLVATTSGCVRWAIPAVPTEIHRSDLCGKSTNCGLGGQVIQWVNTSPYVATEPVQDLLGATDDHSQKGWPWATPLSCRQIADSDYDAIPVTTASMNVTQTNALRLKADIQGRLTKAIGLLGQASATAKLDAALKRVLTTQLELEAHVYSMKRSAYLELKQDRNCQDASINKFVRKQMLVLQVSGTATQNILRNIKGELTADAELQAAVAAAQAKIGPAFESELEKEIKAAINKNLYVLGISWDK
nr:hypothetical protein MFMH1_53000 [Myxococcus sp. MH1]